MALAAATDAGRRRTMYGTNVAVSIVLAFAVLVVAVYLANRFDRQYDWTRSGANSLSPRTIKLLKGLDQNVTITALYTVISEYDKLAQKRQRMVGDLLDLYEAAAPARITAAVVDPMKDQSRPQVILERIKNKPAYVDESRPHREAVEAFTPLIADIEKLLQSELETMAQIAPEHRADKFAIVERNYDLMAAEARFASEKVQTYLTGEFPEYGRAVEEARTFVPKIQAVLSDAQAWMSAAAARLSEAPEPVLAFYRDGQGRYADLLDRCAKLLERTKDLKNVQLDDIYAKLRRWVNSPVILVETDAEARVLTLEEVWPFRRDPNAPLPEDGDTREFAGERAVSSAILQLTQKEKTAVVFTHWGGPSPLTPDFSAMNPMQMREMPRAPFQEVNEILRESNFVTESWDVKAKKEPPKIEHAARTIYVVFPPRAAQPPNPMMQQPPDAGISPADKQLILDAVNASGRALFLTGWSQPTSQMELIAGTAPQYAFRDYLAEAWGIDVKSNLLTVSFMPSPENPGLWLPDGRDAAVVRTLEDPPQARYHDHPIVDPIKTLPSAFAQTAPLEILSGDKAPRDVRVTPLVSVVPSPDIWAIANIPAVERDLQTQRGTRPHENDLLSTPNGFPIAAAAEKGEGERSSRLVVVSSESFAADAVVFQQTLAQAGNALRIVNLNPGNLELFVNALHWLAGEADRIAVGPMSTDVPRLDRLEAGPVAQFCRVFLVGIWPGLMLAAGAGVWMFRRR